MPIHLNFTTGYEKHLSHSTGFHVKGLYPFQRFVAGSDFDKKHFFYSSYLCSDVTPGTVFRASYMYRRNGEAPDLEFWICEAVEMESNAILPEHGKGSISGSFKVLCHARDLFQSILIYSWWKKRDREVDPKIFALHCLKHMQFGMPKECPPMDAPAPSRLLTNKDERLVSDQFMRTVGLILDQLIDILTGLKPR